MDIKKIREIVSLGLPEQTIEMLILGVIAEDKNAIPTILKILESERNDNRELLLDTNLELSRALIVLNDANLRWNKKCSPTPRWIVGEIKKHYIKWKDKISCCYKIDGLD